MISTSINTYLPRHPPLPPPSPAPHPSYFSTAMAIALGVFSTMMLFGFRTFGAASQTLLLNNYHRTDDPLASLARLATGFSILCGYPLMFAALKSSFFNAASEISAKFGEGGRNMASRFQADEGLRLGMYRRAQPEPGGVDGSATAVAVSVTWQYIRSIIKVEA